MSNFFELTKCLFKNMLRSTSQKKSNRVIIIIASIYVMLFFGFTIAYLSSSFSGLFYEVGREVQFLSLVFGITQIVVIFLCVALLMNSLYFSKDNEMFGTLPISSSTVFWSKMSVVYCFAFLISLVIILCAGIPFGIVGGLGVGFYLGLVLASFLVPIMAMFIASILMVIFIPLINRLRSYKILTAIVCILGITILLYAYFKFFTSDLFSVDGASISLSASAISAIDGITNIIFFDTALSQLLLGTNILLNIFVLLGLNIGLFMLISIICEKTYTKGVQNSLELQESAVSSKIKLGDNIEKTLFKRELLSISRYTSLIVYCSASFILPPILIVFYSEFMTTSLDAFTFTALLFGMAFFLNSILQYFALSAFTREGKTFAITKSLPIDYNILAKIKYKISIIMLLISVAVTFIMCFLVFDIAWWLYIIMFVDICLLTSGITAYCVLCDAKNPRMEWDNIYSALQNNPNSLKPMALTLSLMLACIGWFLLCVFVFGLTGVALQLIFWGFLTLLSILSFVLGFVVYKKKIVSHIENIEL